MIPCHDLASRCKETSLSHPILLPLESPLSLFLDFILPLNVCAGQSPPDSNLLITCEDWRRTQHHIAVTLSQFTVRVPVSICCNMWPLILCLTPCAFFKENIQPCFPVSQSLEAEKKKDHFLRWLLSPRDEVPSDCLTDPRRPLVRSSPAFHSFRLHLICLHLQAIGGDLFQGRTREVAVGGYTQ